MVHIIGFYMHGKYLNPKGNIQRDWRFFDFMGMDG